MTFVKERSTLYAPFREAQLHFLAHIAGGTAAGGRSDLRAYRYEAESKEGKCRDKASDKDK